MSTYTALKMVYTLFMAVLIPVYWYYYGPTNFLYFCDVALLLTLIGLWTNHRVLISMSAVGILIPQTFWVMDFIGNLVGFSMTGMTDYMFKDSSLFLRALSLFHGWLPFYLVYLVYKMGYDNRGFKYWMATSVCLLLICFFFLPPPDPNAGLTPVNINYVWGLSDSTKQTWMPSYVWLLLLLLGMPLLLYYPTHRFLKKYFS